MTAVDGKLVRKIAEAVAPIVLRQMDDLEDVPPEHLWTRPRYQWIGFAMEQIAQTALSTIDQHRAEAVQRVAKAICCRGQPCLTPDGVCVMDPMHLDLARRALADTLPDPR